MKQFILACAFSLTVQTSHASELFCEGWYQETGESLEKSPMVVDSITNNNMIFKVSSHGYDFRVDWNKELTTFYVFIEFFGKRILVTTARVPTDNHPENFTDLNIPNGPRLSVNCEIR